MNDYGKRCPQISISYLRELVGWPQSSKRDILGPDVSRVIALVPYRKVPRRNTKLNDLEWPIDCPPSIPSGARIADLRETDHLLATPSSRLFRSSLRGISAKISLLLIEPYAVSTKHYVAVQRYSEMFFRVLSHDRSIVDKLPNAILLEHGRLEDFVSVEPSKVVKSRGISLIASEKQSLPGHRLRHLIVKEARQQGIALDVMGSGYRYIEDTIEGFAPYRFSVVIENSRQPGYFTEKLIDAMLYHSLPIYWGDPSIGSVFDRRGMLICKSAEEIIAAMKVADEILYNQSLSVLAINRQRALTFTNYFRRAAETIQRTDVNG